jgi:hypothetical protein
MDFFGLDIFIPPRPQVLEKAKSALDIYARLLGSRDFLYHHRYRELMSRLMFISLTIVLQTHYTRCPSRSTHTSPDIPTLSRPITQISCNRIVSHSCGPCKTCLLQSISDISHQSAHLSPSKLFCVVFDPEPSEVCFDKEG